MTQSIAPLPCPAPPSVSAAPGGSPRAVAVASWSPHLGLKAARAAGTSEEARMPEIDGIRATEQILAAFDEPPRVVVVTTFDTDSYVYDAQPPEPPGSC